MFSSAISPCPVTRPWNLAIIAMAGFPGIIRGRKKFSVTAAQSVSRKNPPLRSMKRIRLLCHLVSS